MLEETSYVILLLADTYDVPYKSGNDEEWMRFPRIVRFFSSAPSVR